MIRFPACLLSWCLFFALLQSSLLKEVVQADDAIPDFKTEIEPVLRKLCYQCHGEKNFKAELRMDTLNPDFLAGSDLETWHDVLDRVNLGEMPPGKAPQPSAAERRLLVSWMTKGIKAAAAKKRYSQGRVLTRRLTRYEYRNTMRDLLGVELDYAKELPPEPASPDGFLNNGAVLEMSPTQVEAYLAAARKGLAEAIVSGEQPTVHRFSVEETAVGKLPTRKVGTHEPVNPEFLVDIKTFPRTGEFQIKVRASAIVPEGEDFPRFKLSLGCVPGIVHVPRKLVAEVDVTAPVDQPQTFVFRGRMEDFPQAGDQPFGNVQFKGVIALFDFVDADGKELHYPDRIYPIAKPVKKGQPRPTPRSAEELPKNRTDIVIHSVEYEAPVITVWPPESHTRILSASPNADNEPVYVREILERFLPRAFRRAAKPEEVEQYARLFLAIRAKTPTFEEAMRETLSAVLVSPHFLYIVESRESNPETQRLTDYELASRLSYFLWSSMPDERLLELAGEQQLHDPQVLETEVKRMLADERSAEFVSRFADQWFDLEALNRVAVNPEFYPDFDERLKDEMRQETRAFLREILHDNLSCLDLLNSNWTMLNRSLAQHYGLTGPRSSQFEKVALSPEDRRGGLLGQGAFLLSNSNGETSHPIKRAVWILDRLLDSPPAPPPPDVPELDAENADLAGLSLKEQLVVHRQKEACANCHRGIDPWGLPLEHFDAIGRWGSVVPRKLAGKTRKPSGKETPVDATTKLPDGTDLVNAADLKTYLLKERKDLFARAVVHRLATYALGRSLDLGDHTATQQLTTQFINDEFKLQPLIVNLVTSDLFQTK